jgi:hypothetical protein
LGDTLRWAKLVHQDRAQGPLTSPSGRARGRAIVCLFLGDLPGLS